MRGWVEGGWGRAGEGERLKRMEEGRGGAGRSGGRRESTTDRDRDRDREITRHRA